MNGAALCHCAAPSGDVAGGRLEQRPREKSPANEDDGRVYEPESQQVPHASLGGEANRIETMTQYLEVPQP